MKKAEASELGCVKFCTTQWTSQGTDLQNNTGEKSENKTNSTKNPSKNSHQIQSHHSFSLTD